MFSPWLCLAAVQYVVKMWRSMDHLIHQARSFATAKPLGQHTWLVTVKAAKKDHTNMCRICTAYVYIYI